MTSLAAKYDYLEKFASKVFSSQKPEPRKRAYVPFKGKSSEDGPSKKKNKQKQTQGSQKNKQPVIKTRQTLDTSTVQKRINIVDQEAPKPKVQKCTTTNPSKTSEEVETPGSAFSARDLLRQRLHQKIEESRALGPIVDPSSEEVKKRRERRKQERERKKRKKKEFRAKRLAEQAAAEDEQEDAPEAQPAPTEEAAPKDTTSVVFSKVEVGEEYVDKVAQKKEKRKQVKGGLTPLTGRNYKQLLTRVQARKAKLEELREKDPAKAEKEEEKMKWTNMLYKAEGLKIKDNEDMLKASLKKKEKRKAQVKRQWTERSQQVIDKMQNRQNKRRRNLQKRKQGKVEKRKQKARKKGRVLPEDLKKAKLD